MVQFGLIVKLTRYITHLYNNVSWMIVLSINALFMDLHLLLMLYSVGGGVASKLADMDPGKYLHQQGKLYSRT